MKTKKSAPDTTEKSDSSRLTLERDFLNCGPAGLRPDGPKGINRTEGPLSKRVGVLVIYRNKGSTRIDEDDSSNIDNVLRLVATLWITHMLMVGCSRRTLNPPPIEPPHASPDGHT